MTWPMWSLSLVGLRETVVLATRQLLYRHCKKLNRRPDRLQWTKPSFDSHYHVSVLTYSSGDAVEHAIQTVEC